jgi:acetyl esterase/lipase
MTTTCMRAALAALLVLTIASTGASSQDRGLEVRRAIQARIDASIDAMRRDDVAGQLANLAPDYTVKTVSGDVVTRREIEDYFRNRAGQGLQVSDETRVVIDRLELAGPEATVYTSQRFVRTVPGAGGKRVRVETSVTHRESWVETSDGWKVRHVDELEQGPTLVDGTPQPQDRAGWAFSRVVWGEGVGAARRRFEDARRADPKAVLFEEATLNALGYRLLALGRGTDAIEIFRLNTEAYPASYNTFDSLGEAYAAAGDRPSAIANYRRSVEVFPNWVNGWRQLARLGAPMSGREIATRLGALLPASVEVVPEVKYGTGSGRALTMHLVRPRVRPSEPMPAILYVHGGGWFEGEKEAGVVPLGHFASQGYFCASVGYRLSGEATFPAQIEDLKCAVRFLRANARQYNVDPDRIAVWGTSAGGHLAALLGTTGDVGALEGGGGWRGVPSRVRAVVDWNGPTDPLRSAEALKAFGADTPQARLLGGPVRERRDLAARANPIAYVTRDDPPFLIMHGTADTSVPIDESRWLYEALRAAGVDATLHVVEGAGHFGVYNARELDPSLAAPMDAFFASRLARGQGQR